MQIVLTVVDGPQKGKRFDFNEPDIFLLGRDNEGSKAHFRLNNDDKQVSRNHFLLEINPPDCFLRDAGSLNGTFIVRPSSKTIYFLAGRQPDETDYADRASRLKSKLGYSNVQQIEERIRLEGSDVIHVGSSAILVDVTGPLHDDAEFPQIESNTDQCIECGKVLPNSAQLKKPEMLCVDDFVCGDCRKRHLQSRRKVSKVRCYKCGCDVTLLADADGNADEFKHIALYLCPSCAEKSLTGSLPAERIRDYRLISSLGEGGFGVVFLAQHEKTGRAVALKITKEAVKQSQPLIKRFKREVAIMQKLQHPNLVRLYDEGIADTGNYFFASEFLPSGNLVDYSYRKFDGILPVPKACRLYVQALEGLEYLHSKGYVHRDVKPENIVLTKDDKGKRIAKLGDFGLARNYLIHGGSLTAVNEWLGTVVYCPPEQIHDFKHSAPTTDIYSMGIAFYNSVTGLFPYDFPTRQERADMARRGLRPRDPISFILEDDQPIPIEKRIPGIDRSLAKYVNAAINKDAKKRPTSARSFIDALMSCVAIK